jgi:hypothetical protein
LPVGQREELCEGVGWVERSETHHVRHLRTD